MVGNERAKEYYEFKTGKEPVRIKSNESFAVEMIKLSRLVRFVVDPPFLLVEVQTTDGARHKYMCSSADAELAATAIAEFAETLRKAAEREKKP